MCNRRDVNSRNTETSQSGEKLRAAFGHRCNGDQESQSPAPPWPQGFLGAEQVTKREEGWRDGGPQHPSNLQIQNLRVENRSGEDLFLSVLRPRREGHAQVLQHHRRRRSEGEGKLLLNRVQLFWSREMKETRAMRRKQGAK